MNLMIGSKQKHFFNHLNSKKAIKPVASNYDVQLEISPHFVVRLSLWSLYSKYLWIPGTFVPLTILADSCDSG